ncbi:MAG: hypothetical protein QM764_22410 [Chitinophagaceae bacterium]
MNEQNFEYLSKQLKLTGFGEELREGLKSKMEKGETAFTLFHDKDYGRDSTVATLQFNKSENSGLYFFNRYNLLVKTPQSTEPIKQTFYINSKEDNITLKEGYNLMSGRAVHKELTPKEGEKYKAWVQLDFKATDKYGNFEMKKFHEKYGYDLEKTLSKYPLKELSSPEDKKLLVESLERGNRQSATFVHNGKEQRIFVEASPQFKSLNLYDASMKRVQAQTLYDKNNESQGVQQETKKESLQQEKTGGDDDADATGKKQSRRKGQRVS